MHNSSAFIIRDPGFAPPTLQLKLGYRHTPTAPLVPITDT